MSPFLTTLGGGSTKGFGRAFRRIISGPTTVAPTAVGAYPPSYESYNNLTVYWTDAINTGASYQVYFDGVLKTTTATNVFSVNIGSLTANTSYSIYVIAVKNGVSSAQSSTISTSTYPCWTNNQLITEYCDYNNSKIVVTGTGTCGTLNYTDYGNDVAFCGHIPYGRSLGYTCSGNSQAQIFANGNGGTYLEVGVNCADVISNGVCCGGFCSQPYGYVFFDACRYFSSPYMYEYTISDACGGIISQYTLNDPRCGGSGTPCETCFNGCCDP